jgi:hypothetical protein
MPNYSPQIECKLAKAKDLLMKIVEHQDKERVRVEANQLVKFDDTWAELVKDRPVIIVNNQKVDIRITQIYKAIRLLDDIDLAVHKEAIMRKVRDK